VYLDGGFWQIESSRQLASPGPGHVVLPVKLLLQPGDLLSGEGGAVPAHLVTGAAGQRALGPPAASAALGRVPPAAGAATHRLGARPCVGSTGAGGAHARRRAGTEGCSLPPPSLPVWVSRACPRVVGMLGRHPRGTGAGESTEKGAQHR